MIRVLTHELRRFLFAIPAIYTIDKLGRRTLLLATFPNMFWTLLATGMSVYIAEGTMARIGCIALFIFLCKSLG